MDRAAKTDPESRQKPYRLTLGSVVAVRLRPLWPISTVRRGALIRPVLGDKRTLRGAPCG